MAKNYFYTPGMGQGGYSGVAPSVTASYYSGYRKPDAASAVSGGGGGDQYGDDSGDPLTINAQEYKPLVDLQNRYSQALDEFDPATDRGAIRLAQDIRDLNSGMAAERNAGYAARGLRGPQSGDASTLLENRASSDATRAAGRSMGEYREARGRAKLGAIAGGLGIAAAPAEMALREKQFATQARLGEANLGLNRAQTTYDQFLSLLGQNRSSPIYNEPTRPLVGQIGTIYGQPAGYYGGYY